MSRRARAGAVSAMCVLGVLLSIGCATPPENIRPAKADPAPYSNMSCAELEQAQSETSEELRETSGRQSAAAEKDALWVFLLFLPVASMQGEDIGDEVAELKGQLFAIRTSYEERCVPGLSTESPGTN